MASKERDKAEAALFAAFPALTVAPRASRPKDTAPPPRVAEREDEEEAGR
jgi:hypothetical protein